MAKNREQSKKKVIEVLNKARSMELYAIHQYMHQHYNLADIDYGELAANMKLIAIDEMRHAEMFAERIKELDGDPTTERADKVERNQEVDVVYTFDSELEDNTVASYNDYLLVCRENGDNLSVKLFEMIIDEEQQHYNYFNNVASHLEKLGPAYLARIAGTPSETGGGANPGFIAQQGGQG